MARSPLITSLNTVARRTRRIETSMLSSAGWRDAAEAFLSLPGLIGFWPGGMVGSGGTLRDLSTNGLHLTRTGSPFFGFYGKMPAVDFDLATSDAFTRTDEATLDITGTEAHIAPEIRGLTCGMWINFTSLDTQNGLLNKWATSSNQRSFMLRRETGNYINFGVSGNGSSAVLVESGTLTVPSWLFVVARFDPSTEIALFVDQVKTVDTESIPASIFNSTASLELGRWNASAYFKGQMSMVFLCAAAVSDTQLQMVYDRTRPLFFSGQETCFEVNVPAPILKTDTDTLSVTNEVTGVDQPGGTPISKTDTDSLSLSLEAESVTVTSTPPEGDAWYISTTGSATGAGTLGDPWSLTVGIAGGYPAGSVQPGDTVYLRGGTYGTGGSTKFEFRHSGAVNTPIVYRPYPGEHVKLNGSVHTYCSYIRLINARGAEFEICNLNWSTRFSSSSAAGDGVDIGADEEDGGDGEGIELINLVIHDVRQGITTQSDSQGSHLYGCVIYNCGWQYTDRGHGHGIYAQNTLAEPTKEIQYCLVSNDFDNCIQYQASLSTNSSNIWSRYCIYVNSEAFLNSYQQGNWEHCHFFSRTALLQATGTSTYIASHVRDSYICNSKTTWGARAPVQWGRQNPGGDFLRNTVFVRGYNRVMWYKRASTTPYAMNMDYNAYYCDSAAPLFTDYSVDGTSDVTRDFTNWKSVTGYDAHSTASTGNPPDSVHVYPNPWELGRGHIVIYNWSGTSLVSVNLSTLGLANGDTYEIRNIMDYFNETGDCAPQTGTYSSASPTIQVDMRLSRWGDYVRPVAASDATRAAWSLDSWGLYAQNTHPYFGAFVIRRTNGAA
jgi:hypothetical protein